MNKNLIAFLFSESQIRDDLGDIGEDLTHLFEKAAEVEDRDAVNSKTDLASALGKVGIEYLDLEQDPSGAVARFETRAQYSAALNLVAEPDNMHALATLGWVPLPVGDVAMSNEDAEFRMRFLEIATAGSSDDEKEVDAKAISKDARQFATTEVDRDSDEMNPVETDDKGGEPKMGKAKDGADPEGKPKGSTKSTSESIVAGLLDEGGHKSGCGCGFCKNKGKGFKKKEAPGTKEEKSDGGDKKDSAPDSGIGDIAEANRIVNRLIEDDFVTCGGCSHRFDYDGVKGFESGKSKCPECGKTVDESGRVINLESQAVCPGCSKPFNAASNPGLEEGKSKCPNCGTVVKLGEMMTTCSAIPALEMGAKGDGLETKGRGGPRGRKFKMPAQWQQKPAITKKKKA